MNADDLFFEEFTDPKTRAEYEAYLDNLADAEVRLLDAMLLAEGLAEREAA
tara:strand:- start:7571 stop:7723 length:153 start_codon:yes stop_codon:yes gene_type:complete